MAFTEKILIMCGGRGKRMGPVSNGLPKPLMKIQSRTILEHKINSYYNQGYRNFILAVGYKANMIKEVIAKAGLRSEISIEYSCAGENAGILERLCCASNLFDHSVIVTYGDTFTNINLAEFSEKHHNSDNEATIVVAPIQNPFGLVEFDEHGKVTEFREKPVLKYYIGYALFRKSSFDWASEKIIKMHDGKGLVAFYNLLLSNNKLGAYYFSGLQVTFNTPDELKLAENRMIGFYTAKEE